MTEIRTDVVLPAHREDIELVTLDGLTLVGEIATPLDREPVATLVCLHPLPTHGGFMDSHIYRKAAARLPALAGIAVLRFNFRGVESPRGQSEGQFNGGIAERYDLIAALGEARERGLPNPWLVGWSFGTEVALKHATKLPVEGLILLSPPLHRTSENELRAWSGRGVPIVAIVPELDDYLQPVEARERFAVVPEATVIEVEGGRHLWVGEGQTRRVLNEIVQIVAPGTDELPTTWDGPLGTPLH